MWQILSVSIVTFQSPTFCGRGCGWDGGVYSQVRFFFWTIFFWCLACGENCLLDFKPGFETKRKTSARLETRKPMYRHKNSNLLPSRQLSKDHWKIPSLGCWAWTLPELAGSLQQRVFGCSGRWGSQKITIWRIWKWWVFSIHQVVTMEIFMVTLENIKVTMENIMVTLEKLVVAPE